MADIAFLSRVVQSLHGRKQICLRPDYTATEVQEIQRQHLAKTLSACYHLILYHNTKQGVSIITNIIVQT